ncbi:MAG: hypothetical protein NC318_11390 [Blautia sp.]|nr:hypothetical protein [Lachnoclostridium sp.]MCM1212196.1 hypothetical protein [Blautia sp.]
MDSYIQEKNQKSAFLWNSISSILLSFQSAVLLIVISQYGNTDDAGIFTFAYAAANLMVVIGKFGMRQFQASDTKDKYAFSEYLFSRKATVLLMIAVSIPYAILSGAHNRVKIFTILLWCGTRAIEAYEDVYHGFLQKNGELSKGAKILSIRTFLSILAFFAAYCWKQSLIAASAAAFATALIFALLLNFRYRSFYPVPTPTDKVQVKNLLRENMSLFIAYFCTMYLGNAPKYSLNNTVSDEMQAVFGYMFMPVFLVNMLCGFILQPLLTTYSVLWHSKEIKKLGQLIRRHMLLIVSLTVITILGGKFIGIYLLEIIYNVSLQPYAAILYILLFTSGLISVLSYSRTLLTVVRYQNPVLIGYLAACLAMILGGRPALQIGGLAGISIYYAFVILLLDIFSFGLFLRVLHKTNPS